jgi:hypothetical protein
MTTHNIPSDTNTLTGAGFTALCILGTIIFALIGVGIATIGPIWTLITATIFTITSYALLRRRLSSTNDDYPTDRAYTSENIPSGM